MKFQLQELNTSVNFYRQHILLIPLAAVITYYDVRYRRIPNPFVLATFAGGVAMNAILSGWQGVYTSLAGCGLAFILMFMLHVFGAMGAGDVKLFAAIGAVTGRQLVVPTFLVVVLTGGLLALVSIVRSGMVVTTMHRVFRYSSACCRDGRCRNSPCPLTADTRFLTELPSRSAALFPWLSFALEFERELVNGPLINTESQTMRNKRFFIVLVGALLFGLLAAVSVSRYLSSAQAYTKNLTRVAVAKVAIPVGTKIIPEQVMMVQFPKESTPDGAFDAPDKLVGRVAVTNIAPREPITEARLAPEGTAGGLSAVIPEGYRAMTVKVDDVVGISGFIMPGTLVDIVVVIDPQEKAGHAGSDLENRFAEHQGARKRTKHRPAGKSARSK